MPRALRMLLPRHRHRKLAGRPPYVRATCLTLDRPRCAAGDTVSGRVARPDTAAWVALLRLERIPHAERAVEVAGASALPLDGSFTLTLPQEALPSTAGERCALRYVVCARGAGWTDAAELVVTASARPHVDVGSRADRMMASWDARHFHIELWDARLEGGGMLAGRVHCHGRWPAGAMVVKARCTECWRSTTPASRGLPCWQDALLWEDTQPLDIRPDATWAPFGFDLPGRLPRAVEASTLAWRYELVAQRSVRHWIDETAALTALLHDSVSPGKTMRQAGGALGSGW
jgi:hypothetical protein